MSQKGCSFVCTRIHVHTFIYVCLCVCLNLSVCQYSLSAEVFLTEKTNFPFELVPFAMYVRARRKNVLSLKHACTFRHLKAKVAHIRPYRILYPLSLTHTHTLSLSLSLSHTHSLSLSLSLSPSPSPSSIYTVHYHTVSYFPITALIKNYYFWGVQFLFSRKSPSSNENNFVDFVAMHDGLYIEFQYGVATAFSCIQVHSGLSCDIVNEVI